MLKFRGRGAWVRAARRRVHERHDPVGIGERHRLEQDGVDDGKDRGVGADTERQRRHGGGREAAVLAEHPERVSHVLEEGFHTTSCDCSGQYHAGAVRERTRTVPPAQTDAVRRGGQP
jgi:hypothetical protein